MLSYTCSPPGSIIFSKYGHFLSSEENHLVIVKPHSVSYYLTNQIYESADPDVELPFEATIIGAHMFTLPSRQCSSIALITLDLTLIILSSPFSKEGGQNAEEDEQDIPIERTVCDQIRSTHVIPSRYSPLFASSNNQLYISVYPNSLCVITFSDVNSSVVLEKNEIHFFKFLPRFLYGNSEKQKIFAFDTVDNTIKIIDLGKVPAALEEQSYDSSSLLFTERIPITDENGADIDVDYFIMKNDQFLIFSNTELFILDTKERFPLPNTSGVIGVSNTTPNLLYISFRDGDLVIFDQSSKQFIEIAKLRSFTSIVPIENGDVLLFSRNEQPLIYNVDQKVEKFTFSNQMVNILAQTIVPHSLPGHEQLVLANKDELVSYGEGLPFNTSTITSLNGGRLFMVGDFVLVSTSNQTVVLSRDGGDDISSNSLFETNDTTVGFFEYEVSSVVWHIQCCSKKVVAVNSNSNEVVKFDIEIQHAALSPSSNSIIVASNVLNVLKFDGSTFSVSLKIEMDDEISSICVCFQKFLIVSLWKNLAVFVYDVESGQKLSEFNTSQANSKFVVRSICESHGFVFFGTSRGDLICALLNEESGQLVEVCHSHISTSTVNLSSVIVNGEERVCVCSDNTCLVRVVPDRKAMIVCPTNLGQTRFISQVSANEGDRVAVLGDSSVLLGDFGERRIIRVNRKKLNSTVLKLLSVNSIQNYVVALLKNELVVIDTLPFEIVSTIPLDSNFNYTNFCSFEFGEDVIIAVCGGLKTIDKEKFSENGLILFVKNFNEIVENSTISTKGLPTAVTFVNNALFVASGPTIARYSVSKELQFTLAKEAPGMMLTSELIVNRPTAETVHIAIVDAFKSVAVFDFNLHRIATDFLAKYLVAGCNESENSFLATDSRGGVYLMKVSEDRVNVEARMSLGETVTGILPWRPVNQDILNNCGIFSAVSSRGSIVAFLTRIDQKLFGSMEKLQKAMESYMIQNGELSHSTYRCIYSPAYKESYVGYVDANFLSGILEFEEEDRNKLIADNGIDNFDAIYEFLGLLEELNIQ